MYILFFHWFTKYEYMFRCVGNILESQVLPKSPGGRAVSRPAAADRGCSGGARSRLGQCAGEELHQIWIHVEGMFSMKKQFYVSTYDFARARMCVVGSTAVLCPWASTLLNLLQ